MAKNSGDDRFDVELGSLRSPRRRTRRSWYVKTVHVQDEETPEEYDVMIVDHFSRPPKIDFGETPQGKCKRRYVKIINEKDWEALLTIEKVPANFTLSTTETQLLIGAKDHMFISVEWQPKDVGGQHGVIKFIADNGVKTFRLHLSVFGKSVANPKIKKKTKKVSAKPSATFAVPNNKENIRPSGQAATTVVKKEAMEKTSGVAASHSVLMNRQDETLRAGNRMLMDMTSCNFSMVENMMPQITSTTVKDNSAGAGKSSPLTRRGLHLSDEPKEDSNKEPSEGTLCASASPECTLTRPAQATFLTPDHKKKTRALRRRSNTYNEDSPVTPRSLMPVIDSKDISGLKRLPLTPCNLLTPFRAALAQARQKKMEVKDQVPVDSAQGDCQPADSPTFVVCREEDDVIGPLTPVSELARQQFTTLTDEQKRRSTYTVEHEALTNAPAVAEGPSLAPTPTDKSDKQGTQSTDDSFTPDSLEGEKPLQDIESVCDTTAVAVTVGTKRKSMERQTTPEKFSRMMNKRKGATKKVSMVKKKAPVKRTLLLKKPNLSSSARQTLPYVASNQFYDDRWKEKQERGFTRWMNHLLIPTLLESENRTPSTDRASKGEEADSLFTRAGKVETAPSKDYMSLCSYSALRKLNSLRQKALTLFQADDMTAVLLAVEEAVGDGKLSVSKQKALHADLGLRKEVTRVLTSYTPLWLRIGLETILGEAIEMRSPLDTQTLKAVVMYRILSDPNISAKYAHPHVANLYRDGYQEEIGKHILKKLLMLVYLLDRAKLSHLIDYDPCLFLKQSEYKSSRDVLLFFAREIMTGEGDITRHLGHFGYKVSYQQRALEEYQYGVCNIKVDLRDGARLTRVMESLTHDYSLSKCLRIPAGTLTNKRYNVQVALNAMVKYGVDHSPIRAEDIVSGHREKTLRLLWIIISNFQISQLVDLTSLKDEIRLLKKSLKRSRISEPVLQDTADADTCKGLLLQWAALVSAHHNVTVSNFSASFTDGRALCYIIKHYQPTLIKHVNENTTLTQLSQAQDVALSPNETVVDNAIRLEDLLQNDKENFKTLHQAVVELGAVPIIAKSGDMVSTAPDEKITCLYVTYICARLLEIRQETWAARTIQRHWRMKRQRAAALIIQRWWRSDCLAAARARKAQRRAAVEKRRCQAVMVIQQWVKSIHLMRKQQQSYLALKHAVVTAQQRYRANRMAIVTKQWYLSLRKATTVIQKRWRARSAGEAARKAFITLRASAIVIQQRYRALVLGRVEKSVYAQKVNAALRIQSFFKAAKTAKSDRMSYKRLRAATLLIQRWWKATRKTKRLRTEYLQMKCATAYISHWYQGVIVRKQFLMMKSSALIIQRQWQAAITTRKTQAAMVIQNWAQSILLMRKQRLVYRSMKVAATKISCWYKCVNSRQRFLKMKTAAVVVQRKWRAVLAGRECKRSFEHTRNSVVFIQSVFRARVLGRQCLLQYRNLRNAVLCVQRRTRACRLAKEQRMKFVRMKVAATTIQRYYRARTMAISTQSHYIALRKAAIICQRCWKAKLNGRMVRNRFVTLKTSAIVVQRRYRALVLGRIAKAEFVKLTSAVLHIQRYFKALLLAKADRTSYTQKRTAVLTIQQWWRKKITEKQLNKRKKAATKISYWYKCVKRRQRFLKMKTAAVVVQRKWRAVLAGRECKRSFEHTRNSVVFIQSVFRARVLGRQCLLQYRNLRNAVLCVQRRTRACRLAKEQRMKFVRMKVAATTIQRYYRARTMAISTQSHYIALRKAAIICQRCWKAKLNGRMVRNRFVTLKTSAIVVQRRYRALVLGRIAKAEFVKLTSAVLHIQRYFKALLLAKADRTSYTQKRTAVLTIQQWWRKKITEKQLNKRKKAATKISYWYKCVKRRQRFLKMKTAAVVVQRKWRAVLAGRECKRSFEHTRNTVVFIQSVFRARVLGRQCLLQYRNLRNAVLCIQRRTRACRVAKEQRMKFVRMKVAATTIQRYYRARTMAISTQSHYVALRKAAIICQRCWKAKLNGRMVRNRFVTLKTSAIVVQRRYRALVLGRIAKAEFVKLTSAVLHIQRYFKALLLAKADRTSYTQKRTAVLTIQQWWRKKITEKQLNKRKKAATKISYWYKCVKRRQRFLKMKTAAVVVQRKWRAVLAGRECKRSFEHTRNSVVFIQSVFRARVLGRQCLLQYRNLRNAVLCIQRRTRACRLAKEQRMKFIRMKVAATTIQRYYRAWTLAINTQSHYIALRKAAIICQRCWKAKLNGRMVRNRFVTLKASAIVVQRRYRALVLGRKAKAEFVKQVSAVLHIQRYFKALLLAKADRTSYTQQRTAVLTIQQWWRKKITEKQLNKRKKAATKISCWYKCVKSRQRFLKMKTAAVVVQQKWRAVLAGRECKRYFEHTRNTVVFLQSVFRARVLGRQCLLQYRNLRNAVLCIQRRTRACRLAKEQRMKFVSFRESVIRIQAFIRAVMTRRACRKKYLLMRMSAIAIQRWWRSNKLAQSQHKDYLKLRLATICIQSRWRTVLAMRQNQKTWKELRQSVVTLQRRWRLYRQGVVQREKFLRLRKAAITVQSRYRAHVAGRKVRLLLGVQVQAASKVQSFWRAVKMSRKLREHFLHQRESAKTIQKAWRRYQAKRKEMEVTAAKIILRNWRAAKMRAVQKEARKNLHSVIKIQCWYRMVRAQRQYKARLQHIVAQGQAATVIQSYVRRWLGRRKAGTRRRAIVSIQAAVRGWSVRLSMRKKLKEIRTRLTSANSRAGPQRTLAYRNSAALHCVLNYKMITKILQALRDLVVTTKWSDSCRMSMAETRAPSELVMLIRTCNRSEPHKEIIQLALEVFDNLAQDQMTCASVFNAEYLLPTVLELMSIYVETGPLVFRTSCQLLTSFTAHRDLKEKLTSDNYIMAQLNVLRTTATRKYDSAFRANSKKTRNALLSQQSILELFRCLDCTPAAT